MKKWNEERMIKTIKNFLKSFYLKLIVFFLMFTVIGTGKVYADEVYPCEAITIDQSNCGEFLNVTINKLIEDGVKDIFIKAGNYKLNNMINIDKPNVNLIGEDKNCTKLIQTNPNSDSIGVHKVSNVIVENLTIDNSANGNSAFSEGNSNNVMLENCILYGQDTNNFTVYFAGKDYPTSISENPVKGLENNDLDNGNQMINNTIYSKFTGDGVSFSCQSNGSVINNKVYGTRIAMYICSNCAALNNTIENSSSNGINISIPSVSDVISGNTIENSQTSAIAVSAEKEYPVPQSYYGNNITISNNNIKNSNYMGIEVKQLAKSYISNNNIDTTLNNGIYLLLTDGLTVDRNNIINSGNSKNKKNLWGWDENLNSGLFMDYSVKNSVVANNIIRNKEFSCPFGIKEQKDNLNTQNSVINNYILGKFTYPILLVDNTNAEVNNHIEP